MTLSARTMLLRYLALPAAAIALAGTAEALRSLATFVGADTIKLGRVSPKHLAAALRRAL